MPKNSDWGSGKEIQDIMERFVERFPDMFEGFNPGQMHCIITQKKKSKVPVRLISVGHPMEVFVGKPYVVEAFHVWWKDMTPKQKNLAVFHVMCAVPIGGFDETSKSYGKRVQPDIKMYMKEYAAAGGVPNWMENPAAADPMEAEVKKQEAIPKDKVKRTPVSTDAIASVGLKEAVA